MKTRTIRQTVTFKNSPHEVYEALMDSGKHSKFTGAKATISRRIGGKFSIYEGDVTGTNLELLQDEKIVQSWRIVMEGWPEDHFSKATFSMRALKGGTRLDFTQSGVPEECYESVSQGWHDYYWKPIEGMLENKSVS